MERGWGRVTVGEFDAYGSARTSVYVRACVRA